MGTFIYSRGMKIRKNYYLLKKNIRIFKRDGKEDSSCVLGPNLGSRKDSPEYFPPAGEPPPPAAPEMAAAALRKVD